MKRILVKITSLVLCMTFLLSLVPNAFAARNLDELFGNSSSNTSGQQSVDSLFPDDTSSAEPSNHPTSPNDFGMLEDSSSNEEPNNNTSSEITKPIPTVSTNETISEELPNTIFEKAPTYGASFEYDLYTGLAYEPSYVNYLARAPRKPDNTLTYSGNYQIYAVGWHGNTFPKINFDYYDNQGNHHTGLHVSSISKMWLHKENGESPVAFCIEPGKLIQTSTNGEIFNQNNADAAWKNCLSQDQRTAIALIMASGWPNETWGVNPDAGCVDKLSQSQKDPARAKTLWQKTEMYAATQILIWEIVTGQRNPTPPYNINSSFSGSPKSIFDSFYSTSFPSNWNTMKMYYDKTLDRLRSISTLPSFASMSMADVNDYTLEYNSSSGNYETTLHDSNGVLDKYDFSENNTISGLSFSRSGDDLKITATPAAASQLANGVAFSARGKGTKLIDPDKACLVWNYSSSYQSVVTFTPPVKDDPVVAYIKLKADAQGWIDIVKTTSTGFGLGGWTMGIFTDPDCTNMIASGTTYADGHFGSPVLVPPGTYYVKELDTNETYPNWIIDTHVEKVVVLPNQTAEAHFHNTYNRGWIMVQKITSDGTELGGWKVGIYTDKDCKNPVSGSPFTTASDGTIKVPNYFVPGTYYAKEIDEGYEYWECDAEVKAITVTANATTTVEFNNTHVGKLSIVKKMATDGPLDGWLFKVTDSSGTEIEGSPFTTDSEGKIVSGKLLPGDYTIEEIIPEDSYYFCKDQNPQTVTVTAGQTAEVTFTNALIPGEIAISKVDSHNNGLAGVKFLLEWSEDDGASWKPVVYSSSENVVKGGCSNPQIKDGVLTTTEQDNTITFGNLHPLVTYRLTEIETADGHTLTGEPIFEGKLPRNLKDKAADLHKNFTVVNSEGFILPDTGSNTMIFTVIAGTTIAGISATALMYYMTRKRKKA